MTEAVTKQATRTSVYFPGLNGLRFLAAATVMFFHVAQGLRRVGLPTIPQWYLNPQTARLAVVLFFVLSGFLITYLLLTERGESGTISLRKFYIRRILRIWPLYFLLCFLGFVVFPQLNYVQLGFPQEYRGHLGASAGLYVLMLPFLALPLAGITPMIGHLWSVGVEEQFYIFWPILMRWSRRPWIAVLAVLVGWLGIMHSIVDVQLPNPIRPWHPLKLSYIVMLVRFDSMAVGAAAAILVYERRERVLGWLLHEGTQILTYSGLLVLYFTHYWHPVYAVTLYSLLFAVMIVNVATNPASILRLESPILNKLGAASYGIYMYHPVVLNLLLPTTKWASDTWGASALLVIVHYVMGGAITIAISLLSHASFERWFLRRKTRYEVVVSGDDALGRGPA